MEYKGEIFGIIYSALLQSQALFFEISNKNFAFSIHLGMTAPKPYKGEIIFR